MKYSTEIIEKLREELKNPLPGEKARAHMSPPYRPRLNTEQILANQPKIGGVLVLLYEKDGQLHLVLTERKPYNGVHGGQMSFPGGRKEDTDANTIYTALRETSEEIGIPMANIEIIGALTELYIPPSNFLVYPVVGHTNKPIHFIPQETEVQSIVEIPVSFLLSRRNINFKTEIKLNNGSLVRVPSYTYNGYIIWGATAIMLGEFVSLLERALKPAL